MIESINLKLDILELHSYLWICGVALIKLFDISELEFSHRGSGTNDGTDLHLGEYNSVNRSVNWQIDGICVGR